MIYSFFNPRFKIDVPSIDQALKQYIELYYKNIEKDIIFRSENILYHSSIKKQNINSFYPNYPNHPFYSNYQVIPHWSVFTTIPIAIKKMENIKFDTSDILSSFNTRYVSEDGWPVDTKFKNEFDKIKKILEEQTELNTLIERLNVLKKLLQTKIDEEHNNISTKIREMPLPADDIKNLNITIKLLNNAKSALSNLVIELSSGKYDNTRSFKPEGKFLAYPKVFFSPFNEKNNSFSNETFFLFYNFLKENLSPKY